jgi:hypothetical protein
MAALDRALALHEPLTEDGVVAEGGLRLAPGGLERLVELSRVPNDAHAPSAAPGRGLDHQRKPELGRIAVLDDRHPRFSGQLLRLELVACTTESFRRRADEDETRGLDGLGEIRILGEEPVAGMDRLRSGFPRRSDVVLRVEIRPDLDRFAGAPSV